MGRSYQNANNFDFENLMAKEEEAPEKKDETI